MTDKIKQQETFHESNIFIIFITAVFDALAPSKRKEHIRQVTSAKAVETRQRRIAKIVAGLTS